MALPYGVTDYIEGGVITAVIVLNVVIGFYQEFQAEKKMDSLRSLSSPSAAVLREGKIVTVPSAEAVPGDVVQIKAGDTVPADLRLFEAMNLECDEKILTGEAIPVAKDAKADFLHTEELAVGVGDRINMAYSSSTVTKGRGQGIIVFTGMYTEIGKIAGSIQGTKRKLNRSMSIKKHGSFQPAKGAALRTWDVVGRFLGLTVGTPLQRKLSKLAYILFGFAILLAIIVFGVNRFDVTNEVAIYAISTGESNAVLDSDIADSNRYCYHSRVFNSGTHNHNGGWYDPNEETSRCHPSIKRTRGFGRCHKHMLRQDRNTDSGSNDHSQSVDSRCRNIQRRRR